MESTSYTTRSSPPGRVWEVDALCCAAADALDARFNPVTVQGEVSAFAKAPSGHCYFTLKGEGAQLRCAMFRRAALLAEFMPQDGERVELRGRIDVYGARGELQLVVESLRRSGAGAWFEQFVRLKAKLQGEGLFDAARKRGLPAMPRGIGLVTSLNAAALHDVMSTLRRRVPHIPVVLAPALVQGASAPLDLQQALSNLYQLTPEARALQPDGAYSSKRERIRIDVILLVRGGGSLEDLAAFNDEGLARAIVRSPVPVICGVGHETDFTIADFVADARAPTPTAAAELVARSRQAVLQDLQGQAQRLQAAVLRRVQQQAQRVDRVMARFGRPSAWLPPQQLRLQALEQRLQGARQLQSAHVRLDRAAIGLGLLDPHKVLGRGYAWLSSASGQTISSVRQIAPGDLVRATLADGGVDLRAPDAT